MVDRFTGKICCCLEMRLLSRKCFRRQFFTPDSIILQAIHVSEIGLQLEESLDKPFLKIGTTMPDFHIVGTLEGDIAKLKSWKV